MSAPTVNAYDTELLTPWASCRKYNVNRRIEVGKAQKTCYNGYSTAFGHGNHPFGGGINKVETL